MSIPFSDTSTKRGLMQYAETRLGFNDGAITDDATLKARFTAGFNNTIDYIYAKIFAISKWSWQHDDTNKTRTSGYPTATTNLVSGTRTYALTADSDSNAIVDVHKILVADSTGYFHEIERASITAGVDTSIFTDGQTHSGVPTRFTQTGKYITFDYTPNYNYTAGLVALISTEGTYFLVGDTTAKVGLQVYQEYIALRYVAQYASDHSHANAIDLKNEAVEMEQAILTHYGQRGPAGAKRIVPHIESSE